MSNTRLVLSGSSAHPSPHLLYVAHSVYEKDWTSVPHTHAFTEMMFIEEGEGRFLYEHAESGIIPGDFIVVNPGILHTEKSSADRRLGYYVIGVSNLLVSDIPQEVIHLGISRDRAYSIMRSIYKEVLVKNPGYELMVESLLLELTVLLLRGKKSAFVQQQTGNVHSYSSKVLAFIDANYSQDISLDELAQVVNLSRYHLSREFKKDMGLSPMAYLAQRRVMEAKNLLMRTDYTVADISSTIGMSSASYFSQSFRKLTGMAPLAYRALSKSMEQDRLKVFKDNDANDFRMQGVLQPTEADDSV